MTPTCTHEEAQYVIEALDIRGDYTEFDIAGIVAIAKARFGEDAFINETIDPATLDEISTSIDSRRG